MSNCYGDFAGIYDRLMYRDIPYDRWADYIENLFIEANVNPGLVCELACGTGSMTVPLARRGYEMIGVDVSADMLSAARGKAAAENLDILFLHQNMTKLDLYGTVDAVLCMIDGVNYVLAPATLLEMFTKIRTCFLNPGGIVIFDISTEEKLARTIGCNTFIYDTDDIFYTWENRYFPKQRISDMMLHFFVRTQNGLYRRFFERHVQRAYRAAEISAILKKAGFTRVSIYDELAFAPPGPQSQRIVFTAQ